MAEAATVEPDRKTISQAEFADMVKVTRSAVSQAAAAGRFRETSRTPQGFLIYPDALIDWHENADPRRFGPGRTNALDLPNPAAIPAAQPSDDDDAPPLSADAEHVPARPGTLAWERIQGLAVRRLKLEQEMAQAAGRLLVIEDVHAATFDLARALRRALQNIPTWTEDILSAGGDAEKIRGLLKDRARTLMEGIAASMAAVSSGGPADVGDDEDPADVEGRKPS